jgi:hypothetical protein
MRYEEPSAERDGPQLDRETLLAVQERFANWAAGMQAEVADEERAENTTEAVYAIGKRDGKVEAAEQFATIIQMMIGETL